MAIFHWFDGYFHWFWPPFTGLKTWLLCVHKFTPRSHKPSPSQQPGWSSRRTAAAGRRLWLSGNEFGWWPTTSEQLDKLPKTDPRIREEEQEDQCCVKLFCYDALVCLLFLGVPYRGEPRGALPQWWLCSVFVFGCVLRTVRVVCWSVLGTSRLRCPSKGVARLGWDNPSRGPHADCDSSHISMNEV